MVGLSVLCEPRKVCCTVVEFYSQLCPKLSCLYRLVQCDHSLRARSVICALSAKYREFPSG